MSRKRTEKKMPLLEPNFKDILVCQEKEIRPYIEIFVEEAENVFQQNLGTFFGILEINDKSEDSSYMVNYLISIMKKEYFSNVKRGPIESFEAALHKANLALSKLAEHGHISWIGHLNAALAVCEKNNIHVAQTGSSSAFLVRSKSLASINGGEEIPADPNPLKTFQEVISGRLENGDKIILATDALLNIFSVEEIKKSAIKFSEKDFFQFLHTALINELEKAAVLLVDIKEKKEKESPVEIPEKAQTVNAFSQSSFAKKKEAAPVVQQPEDKTEMIAELKKELEKSQGGFVDEKTGHIYIKEDGYNTPKAPVKSNSYIKNIRQKVSSSGLSLTASVKEKAKSHLPSFSGPSFTPNISPADLPEKKLEIIENENYLKEETTEKLPKRSLGEILAPLKINIAKFLKNFAFYSKLFFINRIFPFGRKMMFWGKIFSNRFIFKLKNITKRKAPTESQENINQITKETEQETDSLSRERKKEWFQKLSSRTEDTPFRNSIEPILSAQAQATNWKSKIIPSFSKIKNILRALDNRKKIYAFSILAALFIIPYFIIKITDNINSKKAVVVSETPPEIVPLANDKNVTRISSVETISSEGDNSPRTININGKVWIANNNNMVFPEENQAFPIPQDFQKPDLAFAMDNLNLIHLVKNSKIISFSVTARKFQESNIDLPAENIPAAQAYLTYAYFLDSKANQIYRYPRAEGGFGTKTDWLKENIDLSNYKSVAINENVFITDGKGILKLFRGKKQDFNIEETATALSIDKIFTKPESENLYILDKTNSRIIKVGKDGNILNQYYQPDIAQAFDFAANEEVQKIFFSTEKGTMSFSI